MKNSVNNAKLALALEVLLAEVYQTDLPVTNVDIAKATNLAVEALATIKGQTVEQVISSGLTRIKNIDF
jgi:uncharacterized tellurite resistance protein B-like protein